MGPISNCSILTKNNRITTKLNRNPLIKTQTLMVTRSNTRPKEARAKVTITKLSTTISSIKVRRTQQAKYQIAVSKLMQMKFTTSKNLILDNKVTKTKTLSKCINQSRSPNRLTTPSSTSIFIRAGTGRIPPLWTRLVQTPNLLLHQKFNKI